MLDVDKVLSGLESVKNILGRLVSEQLATAEDTALRLGSKCGCPLLGSDRDKPCPYALQLYVNARWTRTPLWGDFARLMSPSPPRSDATELRKADARSFRFLHVPFHPLLSPPRRVFASRQGRGALHFTRPQGQTFVRLNKNDDKSLLIVSESSRYPEDG